MLEHDSTVDAGPLRVPAVYHQITFRFVDESRDDIQQCRFAGAIDADDADLVAVVDVQRYLVKEDLTRKALADFIQ